MIEEFVDALRELCPADARVVGSQFRGDPEDDQYGKWRVRVVNSAAQLDDRANVYLCVSAMRKNSRGEFRRRKENFAGGLCLMIDDLGDGLGAKFPLETVDALPPTAWVETSARNYQAIYLFREPVEDAALFDALIRAFIDRQFLGADPGNAGINRVFRPPVGVNGKAKHGGWQVRGDGWHPERRFTPREIADAFDLTLHRERPRPRVNTEGTAENVRHFIAVRAKLRAAGMLKTEEPDPSGWVGVSCPWRAEHTGGVDNGAAIRLPSEENGYVGAFRCHHGHCAEKGWRQLTDWLAAADEEMLEDVNAAAEDFSNYDTKRGEQ